MPLITLVYLPFGNLHFDISNDLLVLLAESRCLFMQVSVDRDLTPSKISVLTCGFCRELALRLLTGIEAKGFNKTLHVLLCSQLQVPIERSAGIFLITPAEWTRYHISKGKTNRTRLSGISSSRDKSLIGRT